MSKVYKRNYVLIFFDSVLFVNAMAFISINTVIPYFLNTLGASTFLISLASALTSVGIFITQPIFAKMVLNETKKLGTFKKILLTQRIIFLIFVISLPLISSISNSLMIILFLLFWGIFNLFVGSYVPFYTSIMPKLIPSHQRGRIMGFAGGFGNCIAVLASILIGIILSKIAYPYNYTLIFGIGTIILLLDVLDFHFMVHEPPDKIQSKNISYLKYIMEIPKVLKENKRFSQMVLGFSFFIVAVISLTYYSLYAIRVYHAGAREIAIFTAISMIINTLSSLAFGIIADRYGYRYVLLFSALFGVLAGIFILLLNGLLIIYIAFALSTACLCGYNLSNNMLIIKESPRSELPIYISVNLMITLLISSLTLLISGVIIDKLSFTPIFVLSLICSLGALITFINYKNEPNHI
ncbi:MAG TPA: MFS transporter [Clostridiaceae bacterium]